MKTNYNTRETVDNQVRRMVLRGSAAIFSLALITLSLNAQDLWKQFSTTSTYGKMASIIVGQPSETEKVDAVFEIIDAEISTKLNNSAETFICEIEQDEEMQLEAWMIEESNFNSAIDFNTIETEETLKVENWMISNSFFENQLSSESVDPEKALEIEAWMTEGTYFTAYIDLNKVETEEPLKVENWMINNSCFENQLVSESVDVEKPLEIEAWMIKEDSFNSIESLINKEPALVIENWMTSEDFFKSAETITASGSDMEIGKYTQKLEQNSRTRK